MAKAIAILVVQKLDALLSEEAQFLLGVEERVKSLRLKLQWIQSLLEDAEERRRDNKRIKVWLDHMRELAYDAEDIIDQYFLRIELQQQRHFLVAIPKVWIMGLPTLHVLGKRLDDISARFQEIVACKSHFGVESIQTGAQLASSSQHHTGGGEVRLRRSSLPPHVDAIGLAEQAELLISRLTDDNAPNSVVSIVGMGGSGKTTLANKVYDSSEVKDHFPYRAWIVVSETFMEKHLLHNIAERFQLMDKNEMVQMSEQDLAIEIKKGLQERNYLLVIDDIWSRQAWNCIKSALPITQRGSKVMLTTRIIDVAKYADEDSKPHIMNTLNEEQSWNLLCSRAVRNGSCPLKLEPVGRKIVSRCGGLPLAIIVIGGLLRRTEESLDAWMKVLQRVPIEFREGKDHTLRILGLSYDDLPHHLKSCFLYISTFPEDSLMSAKKLIRLWIAEGFIPQKEELTMEELAEDYLEDLIDRCMVKVDSRNYDGGVKTICIHDLLLDLAVSEAREINFLSIYDKNKGFVPSSNSRRLAIRNDIEEYGSLNLSAPKLRSLVYTESRSDYFSSKTKFSFDAFAYLLCTYPCFEAAHFKYDVFRPTLQFPSHGSSLLRVIDLEGVEFRSLP